MVVLIAILSPFHLKKGQLCIVWELIVNALTLKDVGPENIYFSETQCYRKIYVESKNKTRRNF